MTAERCHTCDRPVSVLEAGEGLCHVSRMNAFANEQRPHAIITSFENWKGARHDLDQAREDCRAHAVDWRARALALHPARVFAVRVAETYDYDDVDSIWSTVELAYAQFDRLVAGLDRPMVSVVEMTVDLPEGHACPDVPRPH